MSTYESSPRPVFNDWARDGKQLEGPFAWFAAAIGTRLPYSEELSAEWFAWMLDELIAEGDCILILDHSCSVHQNGYVQFLAHHNHIHAETTSNEYLENKPLDAEELAHLLALGWDPPARSNVSSAAGSPNFHRQFDAPVPIGRPAILALGTLRDIYGDIRPEALRAKFFRSAPQPGQMSG